MNIKGGENGFVSADVFKCCSCHKIPGGNIFICKKVHPICANCYAIKDNKCRKCNEKLPTEAIRNEFLEEILDGVEFACQFSGNGCKEQFPRQMLTRHFKTCYYYRQKTGLQNDSVSTTTIESPTTSQPQNAVWWTPVSAVVEEEVETNYVSEIETDDEENRQVIYEEEHPAPRINTGRALTALYEAIQLEVDNLGENWSINVETPSSSACEMRSQPQYLSEEESLTASKSTEEIVLSGDEDEVEDTSGESKNRDNSENAANREIPSSSTYKRCRKRTLDCEETVSQKGCRKLVLDIFSFTPVHISIMTEKPELIKEFIKCKLSFSNGMGPSKISQVKKFLSKQGWQFKQLYVSMPCLVENFLFLDTVLQKVTNLKRLIYEYQHAQDALEFLTTLKVCKDEGNIPVLTSLRLTGASGKESLRNEHITKLYEVGMQFKSLEIGDSLWEDVEAETLERLLEHCKDSLENLRIHGGFRGAKGTRKVLVFPKMKVLSVLMICENYNFLPELKESVCKKARVEGLDFDGEEEEPIKTTIKIGNNLPSLKRLGLGNSVEFEDLYFSTVRKLTSFRCGSYWNLSLQFPPESSRKMLLQSKVTYLKFPDTLKDPSFPGKVMKHFPNLKKVGLYLPSVAVLQAFFKAFENSCLKELYLRTQFDFAFTLESCLFPGRIGVKKQDEEIKRLIQTLKGYKHFEEYVAYHNLEFPPERMENESETKSVGITGLKKLKALSLTHIPRTLFVPVKDEERKWDHPDCNFLNATLGFDNYPLAKECHEEIVKLNLREFKPSFMINRSTGEFYQSISNKRVRAADEKLFKAGRLLPSSTYVKVMPSRMLPGTMTIKSESN